MSPDRASSALGDLSYASAKMNAYPGQSWSSVPQIDAVSSQSAFLGTHAQMGRPVDAFDDVRQKTQ